MSTFDVTLRRIARVWPHSNADRLEMAEVEGLAYRFVVPKGAYTAGDRVVYFPIDALLPDELSTRLGVKTYLAGSLKNRVKTAKLRGEISQGVVASPDKVREGVSWEPDVDYAALLGVTKYEPPAVPCHAGTLRPLPPGVSKYDIEGGDRFPDVVALLLDQPCFITEKLEGMNWSATRAPDGRVHVCQRGHSIEPVPDVEHDFWKATREQGLLDALEALQRNRFPERRVTLRGEYLGPGVQKNIYGLKRNEIRAFDLEVDGEPLAPRKFLELAGGLLKAPALALDVALRDWLAGRTLRDASNGRSELAPVAREGVVVKPMAEQRHERIGRLFIKQRSPEYLASSDF